MNDKSVLLFFMDGVGMGDEDGSVNPFVPALMPYLTSLFGKGWFLAKGGQRVADRASLIPTDANLGVAGSPQSATGQATILTGRNVPALFGQHFGPKPDKQIGAILEENNLFKEVVEASGKAALLTPYPPRFFEGIESGRRLLSAVPLAAVSAGISLMTDEDLRYGRAVSPDFTGEAWRNFLGYPDMPLYGRYEAGQQIAQLAQQYQFSFFEHWPTDHTGHRGSLEQAVAHLELIDEVIGGLFDCWDDQNGLIIITSDHGNLEAKNHRQHTRNPVPTILMGQGHAHFAQQINDLTDIARVVRQVLDLS